MLARRVLSKGNCEARYGRTRVTMPTARLAAGRYAGPYTPRFNERKFRELVLYVAARSREDKRFGKTKLNKLLWACDFFAYGQLGESITGATYKNRDFGPAPHEFVPVTNKMESDKELVWEPVTWGGQTQQRAVALRSPDLQGANFTPDEVGIIDEMLNVLTPAGARGVTRWTHDMRGWLHTKQGDVIPYESVFVGDSPLPPEVLAFAKQRVEERRAEWEKEAAGAR